MLPVSMQCINSVTVIIFQQLLVQWVILEGPNFGDDPDFAFGEFWVITKRMEYLYDNFED